MGNILWIFNLFQINSTIEHEHEQEHHLAEIIVRERSDVLRTLWALPLAGKFHSSSMYPWQLEPFQLFFIEQSFKFERPRASIKIEVVSLSSKKHLLVLATRIDCHSALSISNGSRLKFFEKFRDTKESLKSFELLYVAYLKLREEQLRYFRLNAASEIFQSLFACSLRFKGKVENYIPIFCETFATSCLELE